MQQLERDLTSDLVHSDQAVLERTRKLVKEFLMHEAGKLAQTHVKDEAQIVELLRLHARVNLLRALTDNPRGFSLKDQKELFKSIGEEISGSEKPADFLSEVRKLDVPDNQKAKLLEAAMDTMRDRIRGQLGRGS